MMELWTCTVEGYAMDRALIGVFSTKENAKKQAEIFMNTVGTHKLLETIDEAESDEALCYETLPDNERYVIYIEKYRLDQFYDE